MPRSLPSRSSRPKPARASLTDKPRVAPKRVSPSKSMLHEVKQEEARAAIEIGVDQPEGGQPHHARQTWPTERIVSPEEKRKLILAHAQSRVAKGVGGIWTYYIGIAASFLIVGTGWWFTVGSNIRQNLSVTSNEPGLIEQIQAETQQLDSHFAIPETRTDPLPATSSTSSVADPSQK